VIRPIDHVRGRKTSPVLHGEEVVHQYVFVVVCIKVADTVMHHWRGISGVDGLNDRVQRVTMNGCYTQDYEDQKLVFYFHFR
jgi:hypothetical protein